MGRSWEPTCLVAWPFWCLTGRNPWLNVHYSCGVAAASGYPLWKWYYCSYPSRPDPDLAHPSGAVSRSSDPCTSSCFRPCTCGGLHPHSRRKIVNESTLWIICFLRSCSTSMFVEILTKSTWNSHTSRKYVFLVNLIVFGTTGMKTISLLQFKLHNHLFSIKLLK